MIMRSSGLHHHISSYMYSKPPHSNLNGSQCPVLTCSCLPSPNSFSWSPFHTLKEKCKSVLRWSSPGNSSGHTISKPLVTPQPSFTDSFLLSASTGTLLSEKPRFPTRKPCLSSSQPAATSGHSGSVPPVTSHLTQNRVSSPASHYHV